MLIEVTAYGSRTDLLQLQSLVLTPRQKPPHGALVCDAGVWFADFALDNLMIGKVGGFARVTDERRELLGGLELCRCDRDQVGGHARGSP